MKPPNWWLLFLKERRCLWAVVVLLSFGCACPEKYDSGSLTCAFCSDRQYCINAAESFLLDSTETEMLQVTAPARRKCIKYSVFPLLQMPFTTINLVS